MHKYMHIFTMGFEWDEAKRALNKSKHGLDFVNVCAVFQDEQAYIYPSRGEFDEQRYVIVGKVQGLIIAVVFTERGENKRIISARIARREERARYGQ